VRQAPKADDKWEPGCVADERQREDDDAQQVIVEFLPGGPQSTADNAMLAADGITRRVIVTAAAADPIKGPEQGQVTALVSYVMRGPRSAGIVR
jgi:hypothetical protein